MDQYWHIDDSLIGTDSVELTDRFHKDYSQHFNLKTFEPVKNTLFAGIMLEYDMDGGFLKMSQPQILERIAEKYFGSGVHVKNFSLPYTYDGKSRTSSLDKLRRAENDEERRLMKEKPLLSVLMALLYVAVYTRGDCLFPIVKQGRFMSDPAPYNWEELVRLFGYMYHSRHRGIVLQREFRVPKFPSARPAFPADDNTFFRNLGLFVMPDASWKTLNSYAGYGIFLLGACIDFNAQLIKVICHSSAEAETAAATFAGKRFVYVLQLLRDLGHDIVCPVSFLIDCSAVEDLSKKLGATKRTEHFLRWFHHFRWLVLHQYSVVHAISDLEQYLDICTKAVNSSKWIACSRAMLNDTVSS